MDGLHEPQRDLVQFARVALIGDPKQTEAFVRRLVRSYRKTNPVVAIELEKLISASTFGGKSAQGMRGHGNGFIPVDHESRMDLLKIEMAPHVTGRPRLSARLESQIDQIVAERGRTLELQKADLDPSRTLLFTGPPGVGKTLVAHWIAQRLEKPLFTLDLASVMSSLLGRTGVNLRAVLDYARHNDGVLFLDEFDAVAKRRADSTEVGELKRLVTVLLQEIDIWPADRLLIAATNHGELLDPAIWRRFDVVLDFPLPTEEDIETVINEQFAGTLKDALVKAFSKVLKGKSYSDVVRASRMARRRSLLSGESTETSISELIRELITGLSKPEVKLVGRDLEAAGMSQRFISDLTGLSRDTIRKGRINMEAADD